MIRILVCVSIGGLFALGCTDPAAPTTSGRWAATGIELTLGVGTRELHVACARPVQLPMHVRFDRAGRILFTGNLTSSFNSFPFTFSGFVHDDTLTATLSVQTPSGTYNQDHTMTRDGKGGFEGLHCAGALGGAA